MNEKFKELYEYLKGEGMTDLGESQFFDAYKSGDKYNELYSYLKDEGMTDLDSEAFQSAYFGETAPATQEPVQQATEPVVEKKNPVSTSVSPAPQENLDSTSEPVQSESSSDSGIPKADLSQIDFSDAVKSEGDYRAEQLAGQMQDALPDDILTLTSTPSETTLNNYEELKKANVFTDQQAEDIAAEAKAQEAGEFSFKDKLMGYVNDYISSTIENPHVIPARILAGTVPIVPMVKPKTEEDLRKEAIRKRKVDFVKALPTHERQSLQTYIEKAVPKLSQENQNVLAETQVMTSKAKQLMGYFEGFKDINPEAMTDEQITEFNRNLEELKGLEVNLNRNFDIIESNEEDLNEFAGEIDLLKRNYGILENSITNVGRTAASIAAGVVEMSGNLGIIDKEQARTFSDDLYEVIEKSRQASAPRMSVNDIDSYEDFFEWTAQGVSEQAINIGVMAVTGGSWGGLLALGASAGGEKSKSMRDSRKFTEEQILLASTGFMLSEAITEKFTAGLISKGKRAYMSALTGTTRQRMLTGTSNFLKNSTGEATTEVINQGFQNGIDIMYLGNKNLDFTTGMDEAAATAFVTTSTIQLPTTVAVMKNMMIRPLLDRAIVNTINKNVQTASRLRLEAQGMREIGDVKIAEALEERANTLMNEASEALETQEQRVSAMNRRDMSTVFKLTSSMSDITRMAEFIENDSKLSEETKQEMLADLKTKFDEAKRRKQGILNKYAPKEESTGEATEQEVVEPTQETKTTEEVTPTETEQEVDEVETLQGELETLKEEAKKAKEDFDNGDISSLAYNVAKSKVAKKEAELNKKLEEQDEQRQETVRGQNETEPGVSGDVRTGREGQETTEQPTDQRKQELSEKVAEAEKRLKDAFDKYRTVGIMFDPKEAAERDAEMLKAAINYVATKIGEGAYDIAQLTKKYLGQGIVNIAPSARDRSLITRAIIEDMKSIGVEMNEEGAWDLYKRSKFETRRRIDTETNANRRQRTEESKLKKAASLGLAMGRQEVQEKLDKARKDFKGFREVRDLFTKGIKEYMKGLKDIPAQKVKGLINRINAVNPSNYNTEKIDDLMDEVADILDNLFLKQRRQQLGKTLKKVKAKGKSKSKNVPVNIRELAKMVGRVNPKYLTDEELSDLEIIAQDVLDAYANPLSDNYLMADQGSVEAVLEEISSKIEGRIEADLAQKLADRIADINQKEGLNLLTKEDLDAYLQEQSKSRAKEIRQALEDMAENMYKSIARGLKSSDPINKKRLATLRNAPIEDMSAEMLKRYMKVVDNIETNDDYSGVGPVVAYINAINNNKSFSELLKDLKIDVAVLKSGSLVNTMRDYANTFTKLFGNKRAAATFNMLSGLQELSYQYAKTKKQEQKVFDEYIKLLDKISKRNPDIRSQEQKAERSIVSTLIQGNLDEDLQRSKERIEGTIEQYRAYKTDSKQKMADMIEEIYAEYRDAQTQQEVLDIVKSKNNGQFEILDFWMKNFEAIREDLARNTREVHNEAFVEVSANYLPQSSKKIKFKDASERRAETDRVADNRPLYLDSHQLSSKMSPTTIARTEVRKLPDGHVINLDFDFVQMRRYYQSLLDINTSQAVLDVNAFFNSKELAESIGQENVDALQRKNATMLTVQRRLGHMNKTQIDKVVADIEQTVRSIAAARALGGLTQYPKQYLSVMAGAMVRLWQNPDLLLSTMFTDKSNIELLNMSSIALRGDVNAGIGTAVGKMSNEEKLETNKAIARLSRSMNISMEKARELLFLSLRKGDVNIAKSSWLAYYREYMRKNGKEVTMADLETEHERVENDPLRKEAMSYADLQVEETQIASDETRQSEFYSDDTAHTKRILRSIFLPYQSFNVQAKVRMLNAIQNFTLDKGKGESLNTVAANLAEIATFHAMKIYVLGPLMAAGADWARELMGFMTEDEAELQKEIDMIKEAEGVGLDEDISSWLYSRANEKYLKSQLDKEAENEAFQHKKFKSAMIKDVTPFAVGTFGENGLIEIMNLGYYLLDDKGTGNMIDWTKKYREEEGSLPFYRYGDAPGFSAKELFDGAGQYETILETPAELFSTLSLALSEDPGHMNDYGGFDYFNMTPEQRSLMRYTMVADLLNYVGAMEVDSYRMLKKIQREQLRIAKTNKSKAERDKAARPISEKIKEAEKQSEEAMKKAKDIVKEMQEIGGN